MSSSGLFDFVKTILDNYVQQCREYEAAGGDLYSAEATKEGLTPPNTQLPIAALRCTRRVLATKENADQCLSSGCSKSVLNALRLSWTKSMLTFEALRVIFTMISIYSGKELLGPVTSPTSASTGRNANRGKVPRFQSRTAKLTQAALAMQHGPSQNTDPAELLASSVTFYVHADDDGPRERIPSGQRAWQMLQMTDEEIDILIQVTRKALAEESVSRNLRLYRLGLGCLTYFACEKKGFDALYRRLNIDDNVDETPIDKYDTSRRRSLQVSTPRDEPKNSKKRRALISYFKPEKQEVTAPTPAPEFGVDRPRDRTSILDLIFHALDTFVADKLIVEEVSSDLY